MFLALGLYQPANAQIELGVEDLEGGTLESESKTISGSSSVSVTDNTVNLLGKETNKNEEKVITIEEIKNKADNGDVQSQLDLGYMFLYGANGADVDYKQAIHYYELAAKSQNPTALNNMGSLYFNGIGTEVNYPKAISYFEEAAKLGSNDAALNLAIIYLGNTTKSRTKEEWTKIYKLLNQAQKSNYAAKYLLGYAYYVGFLVDKNDLEAFKLIKEAADNNYDEAQFVLSDFYIKGKGTVKNYTQAVKYLRAAAHQGHLGALMKLAQILAEGKIYTQNIMNAHVLYNVASVMGAKDAAEKRDELEKMLKIEDLLAVQANAENFKPEPSKNTNFIRQTFGNSMRAYIDTNLESSQGVVIDFN